MKNSIKLVFALILVLSFSCETESISESENLDKKHDMLSKTSHDMLSKSSNVKTTVDVFNPILGRVTGSSTLHRTKKGITFNYSSNELTPGYAYTLWVVIWNNPENCAVPNACIDSDFAIADMVEVEVLYGAGHVIGNNGKGNFSGHLKVDDDSESINDLFGLPEAGGLQSGKSFSSEVHFVLRSHGPAAPGLIDEQISSYEGGCDDPYAIPPFTEIPDEMGECGDIEFSIHSPVES